MKKLKNILFATFILLISSFTSLVYADDLGEDLSEGGEHYGLGQVSFEASMMLQNIAKLILYVAIVAGIAFILTSLLKLKQHWKNPQQVPISQVISLFILGLVLVGIPLLINYNQNSTTFSTSFFYNEDSDLQLALN